MKKEILKPLLKINQRFKIEKPQNVVKLKKLTKKELREEIKSLPNALLTPEKAQPTAKVAVPGSKELSLSVSKVVDERESKTKFNDPDIILSRPGKRLESIKKPPKKQSVLRKTFHYAKPHMPLFILALICAVINSIAEILVPVYIGKAIDCLATHGVQFELLKTNILLIILFAGMFFIFKWLTNSVESILSFKTAKSIRDEIYKKFNKVPLKYIDGTSHGDLQSRMINDVEDLTEGFLEGISSIFDAILSIGLVIFFMFKINVPIATTIVVLTPFSVLSTLLIAKKSNKYFNAQAKSLGDISGNILEMVGNQRIVKSFNYEERAISEFEKLNKELQIQSENATFYSNISNPTSRLINSLIYGIVAIMGCLYGIKGLITIGSISVLLSYANKYMKPFNEIADIIGDIQEAIAGAKRIYNMMDIENEKSDADCKTLEACDGEINIKDVNFSYVADKKLIEDLNVKVIPGQKVAIVGPTGCGKSTLINLLMRFYDINSGDILIDNNSIYSITRDSLRSKYGMVLQDTWLFNASIKDNIAYGKADATMEEIISASKLAHAHEFIQTLENGYDTLVTEGGDNLSAGQKQLICIARIMLSSPPMLILDEATSNIDTRTELLIQDAFDTMMQGKTSFIVAHRLSTIVSSDLILVMNKGNIIEQGTHESLLEQKGFYYALYNSQFQKI